MYKENFPRVLWQGIVSLLQKKNGKPDQRANLVGKQVKLKSKSMPLPSVASLRPYEQSVGVCV